MPLLTSPIDGSPMRQISRFGIELDICPTSGAVWLDKGELEKLLNFIKESAEEDARNFPQPRPSNALRDDDDRSRYQQRYSDDDDRSRRQHRYNDDDYRKGHYKNKSGMSKIMDIFDF
jgi:Zn-finger nucleic acid-binding protein